MPRILFLKLTSVVWNVNFVPPILVIASSRTRSCSKLLWHRAFSRVGGRRARGWELGLWSPANKGLSLKTHPLLAMWPWPGYFTSLGLSFHKHKYKIKVPVSENHCIDLMTKYRLPCLQEALNQNLSNESTNSFPSNPRSAHEFISNSRWNFLINFFLPCNSVHWYIWALQWINIIRHPLLYCFTL